jgi:hypothetical protein
MLCQKFYISDGYLLLEQAACGKRTGSGASQLKCMPPENFQMGRLAFFFSATKSRFVWDYGYHS